MFTTRSVTLLLSFATLSFAKHNLAGSGLIPLNLSSSILGGGNALVSPNALSNIIGPSSCAAHQVVGATVLVSVPRSAVCGCVDVIGGTLEQSACPQCPMNSVAICGNGNCGCACIAPYFATDFHTCVLRSACPDNVNGSSNLVNNHDGTSSCTCPSGYESNGHGGCKILQYIEVFDSAVVLNSATVSQPEKAFASVALAPGSTKPETPFASVAAHGSTKPETAFASVAGHGSTKPGTAFASVTGHGSTKPETAFASVVAPGSTTKPRTESISGPVSIPVTAGTPQLESSPDTSSTIISSVDSSANIGSASCPPGTVNNRLGVCVFTPSARARLSLSRAKRNRFMCGNASETACSTRSRGFECLDVTQSFESCGGCPGEGGINCGDIPGAMDVACSRSKCNIYSCLPGWNYVTGTCIRK